MQHAERRESRQGRNTNDITTYYKVQLFYQHHGDNEKTISMNLNMMETNCKTWSGCHCFILGMIRIVTQLHNSPVVMCVISPHALHNFKIFSILCVTVNNVLYFTEINQMSENKLNCK